MKTKINKSIAGIIFLVSLHSVSCRDYVEVDNYTTRALKYTDDYQYLMNDQNNFSSTYILPLITNDDVDMKSVPALASWTDVNKRAYIWNEYIYSETQQDNGWNNLYNQIFICNEVLGGVMDSERGTDIQKKEIAAEAKIHRAYAYLMLVNQYAGVYNPATAMDQPGVPLLLTSDLFSNLSRASLADVYQQVINDASTAIADLPDQPVYVHHPAKGAAYALLARCYLYMRNFELAAINSEKALEYNSSMLNLEQYVGKTNTLPITVSDTETFLFKKQAGVFNARLNDELVSLYDLHDLRLKLYIASDNVLQGYKYIRHNYSSAAIYVGLRVPEMVLIRAEAYAREGNSAKTAEWLNKLRVNRFAAATYVPVVVDDIVSDPLQAVLDERRRELVGTGLRWFDLRRLTLDQGYVKDWYRQFENQIYTLAVSSPRYVYPIPENVLDLSPEIGQNPR